ncbi:hypothetical protein GCM10018777_05630 [Streptomyces albogriseolus]|nr:hypothetical protein GCM10018777_05630 [Streptomyces viridodiastaticus]
MGRHGWSVGSRHFSLLVRGVEGDGTRLNETGAGIEHTCFGRRPFRAAHGGRGTRPWAQGPGARSVLAETPIAEAPRPGAGQLRDQPSTARIRRVSSFTPPSFA